VGVALAPVWQRAAAARAPRAAVKIDKPGTRCLASKDVMRTAHMQILDDWRDGVVRDGIRVERAADGSAVTRSLGGTCLECHGGKKNFCDSCHQDLAVRPVCWECHADPRERS
jgi:hypothetical protein